MKAVYYSLPDAMSYMPLPDGRADVWLRKGVTEAADDEGTACWECDEVYMRTALLPDEVTGRFDELFAAVSDGAGCCSQPTVEERVRDLESQIEEQAGAIEELAMMVAGGE